MALFKLEIDQRGNLLVFEAWHDGENGLIAEHAVKITAAGYLGLHNAFKDTVTALEKEVDVFISKITNPVS